MGLHEINSKTIFPLQAHVLYFKPCMYWYIWVYVAMLFSTYNLQNRIEDEILTSYLYLL